MKIGNILLITSGSLVIGIIIIRYIYRTIKKCRQNNNNNNNNNNFVPHVIVPIRQNYGSNQPANPINYQEEILADVLTPTIEMDDINDVSPDYSQKIINSNPESLLFPIEIMPVTHESKETCVVCLDSIPYKYRPIIKLSCQHYYHYSCYETLVNDQSKDKRVRHLCGEKMTNLFKVNCSVCRGDVIPESIYLKYPPPLEVYN